MELMHALLAQLFGHDQAGGKTMSVGVTLISPTHCSAVSRFSTCGGDETRIIFRPPLPLEEALLHARKYDDKGCFTHS
jgi:hypothetical protein